MKRILVSNGNPMETFVDPEWLVEFEADAIVSDGATPETVGP